ncbi:hypothetical protein [Paenibacillus sinopodophylli]|uniref:hypothetical protein n=1 Tax=Paenibacillus sinopodophylli TaxID=1837342 RepID=UPI00110D1626|nr:hypothetical protein [Paenibacillus sinopodophylli]
MEKKEWQGAEQEAGFSKQQLLAAKRYRPAQKDVLSAVLNEQDSYTHEQALSRITAYLKKEVM